MRRKLLLVEDEPAIASMLTVALGGWGFETLYAPNAAKAAKIARAEGAGIAVVLCDVALPDGSGVTLADTIRKHCPGVWIIFTSGYPVDVLTERGLMPAGALQEAGTLYLPKPFLPRDVRDLVGCAFLTKVEPARKEIYAAAAH
jgi:DNA-binding response OmpR family regulator